MVAGTQIGAFASDNRGRTWRWIYYETLPTQNHVSSVAVHPTDPKRIILGTKDGLFYTGDGGLEWRRAGGVPFTGNWVRRVVIDPEDAPSLMLLMEAHAAVADNATSDTAPKVEAL